MRIVCISDTHLLQPPLPDGDVLIHAGDLTLSTGDNRERSFGELRHAAEWLERQPHRHKIVIAGNHDRVLDPNTSSIEWRLKAIGMLHVMGFIYLCDEETDVAGLRIYGTPWTSPFHDWSFQVDDAQREIYMAAIPDRIDVLVSHGPPRGMLDKVRSGDRVGCPFLRKAVHRVRPKLHVFGHIHEAYGIECSTDPPTMFVNASITSGLYGRDSEDRPIAIGAENLPVVIDL